MGSGDVETSFGYVATRCRTEMIGYTDEEHY
jgi:hypothetical protein